MVKPHSKPCHFIFQQRTLTRKIKPEIMTWSSMDGAVEPVRCGECGVEKSDLLMKGKMSEHSAKNW